MKESLKIEHLQVDQLKPYERNARIHGKDDVNAIAESIKQFGFNDPIGIWGEENIIVEGHGRLLAAQQLGMEKVPCIRLDHLTDEQRRAYALAHNRTAELSEWDPGSLKIEIGEIPEIDLGPIGFDLEIDVPQTNSWFDREEREGDEHEEGNDDYNEFVDKFKTPKTTDDCYTPDNIYEVVASYVEKKYGVNRNNFVRPFYPGGDYQAEKYKKTDVVVDNPPFSILSEIVNFYVDINQPFFLFAPGLMTLNYGNRKGVTAICLCAPVTYENKACVSTSFITNMEPDDVAALTAPDLYADIKKANDENEAELHSDIPKYEYPVEILTAAKLGWLSKYGQEFKVKHSEAVFVRALDAQKEADKSIFGGALLLSEKAAAEKAAAMKWPLSDREKEMLRRLEAHGGLV